ncbi:hypothetical protein Q73_13125 [Bacillus coahuilensis m2-6]|uniref:alpha/beta fold hydrolase n=1 Tax=Bacillus coahuilensis TaxID=408580 RepID=UPI0007501C31|nr:alpha/beta fold hydrolase [Bacillus coahuilensis]KUP05469.1 hypothetical protein Q73_13125 [Bacillus coahuilensis m2-6]
MQNKEKERWSNFVHALATKQSVTIQPTPRQSVWKWNKSTLWYYPAKKKKYGVPLFLVYSLINQPFVLDLQKGRSLIESLVTNGFDVYLLDFGIPAYEDRYDSLDDYIGLIGKGIRKALRHSNSPEISIIGFCLGGTLAAIYASIAKEPIRNLILSVTPVDFFQPTYYPTLTKLLRQDEIDFSPILRSLGLIPADFVEAGMRLITSPFYYSPYLSLLAKADSPKYVESWKAFNTWSKGHIPISGRVVEELIKMVKDNSLIKGELLVQNQKVDLAAVTANLLVVASELDALVPYRQVEPIMNKVSSHDKRFVLHPGGHALSLVSSNGTLPDYLKDWLPCRSTPLTKEDVT